MHVKHALIHSAFSSSLQILFSSMKYLTVLCITLASMLCFTNADRHWKCGCSCDFYPEPVGDQKNPGFSCKDILENNEAARNYDGIYWITLSGKFGAR